MSALNHVANKRDFAQVAMPQKLLAQLIANGLLHCNECQCLNPIAKQVIWETLLLSSISDFTQD